MLWPSGSARGAFDARSPLAFPVGRLPGFDPTHPAAAGMSGINGASLVAAGNGNLQHLLIGGKPTITGSPSYAALGGVGHSYLLSSANAGFSISTPNPAPVAITFGMIAIMQSVAAPDHDIANWGGNLVPEVTSSGVLIYNAGYVTSSLVPVAGIPYLFVISLQGSGAVNFLMANLATGAISTDTKSTPNAVSALGTTMQIGHQGATQPLNGWVSTFMWSPTFLSIPAICAWGVAPWDFWYPPISPSPFMTLDSISAQQTPAAILDSYGSVIYRPRARRWGYAA